MDIQSNDDGIIEYGPSASVQIGLTIIRFDVLDQSLIVGNLTEILPVSFDSIETVIHLGNHHGNHLALGTAQTRWTMHESGVEPNRCTQNRRIEALYADHIEDAARPLDGRVILTLQKSGRFFRRNRLDPGHGVILPVPVARCQERRDSIAARVRNR